MTVLIRWPMPTSRATRAASTTHRSTCLSMISCWTSRGRWSQTWSAGQGLLSRNVAPGRPAEHVHAVQEVELVAGDEGGPPRSGRWNGSAAATSAGGTVTDPDFLESSTK